MAERYTIHHFDDRKKMLHYINQQMGPNDHVVCFLPSHIHTWSLLIEYRPEK